jgi:spore coat protein U-like protein
VTGGTLDFGSKTGGASVLNATGSTTFTATCVSGKPYTISMSPAGGSTSGTGNMTNGGTADTVAFALCQDSTACGTAWGNVTSGLGANVKSGTGTGSAQTYTVYGKITGATPASGYVKPVVYSNTTTITVTY